METKQDTEHGPISYVLNDEDLAWLTEAIAASSEVIMDLETTGLNEHAYTGGPSNGGVAARVACASFTLPQRRNFGEKRGRWDGREPISYVIPLSHEASPFRAHWRAVLRDLCTTIVDYDRPLWNANVKFDARWVYATTGVDLAGQIEWDTQVSSHLLDENASTKLKERAPETFGIEAWNDGIDFTKPGAAETTYLFDLMKYAALDTYWTWRLAERHRSQMFITIDLTDFDESQLEQFEQHDEPIGYEEIRDARLGTVATTVAMPTVQALTDIEQRGFKIDLDWVKTTLEEDEQTADEEITRLAERYDMPRDRASMAATSKWFQELTQLAIEDGQLRIGSLTPTGKPQWSAGVLKRQARSGSDVAAQILKARKSIKRAEFLRSWTHEASQGGTIHSTYWPGRVVTGRLSSSNPNMQQVSRELRPAFIPRKGFVIADFDYSQIELRVAAFISRSVPMLEAYNRGDDLHRLLAAQIAGIDPEAVTGQQRQDAKAGNFGFLYGMGAEGFVDYADAAYDVQFTLDEAETTREAFFTLWDGLSAWHQTMIDTARRYGEVISPLGRVRRLPDIHSENAFFRSGAERKAINSPVQGMASDLLMLSAASMLGFLPHAERIPGLKLVATVHDSLVAEVPENRWQEVCEQAQERMGNLDEYLRTMGVDFDVPLVADASVGSRWGLTDIGEM